MRIEIEANTQEIEELIVVLNNNPQLANIKKQLITLRDQDNHEQSAEIPAEGDDQFIERSE